MTVRVVAEAEAEMEAARDYLERKRAGLGVRFLDDLSETLAAIEARPLTFGKLETLAGEPSYRRALLGVFRYAAVFEVVNDEVVVLALVHCSRKPNYWLGRRT